MQANAAASQFEAEQLMQNAGQERAASQRKSMEEQRKAKLVASRALALSAAGGGNVSDPGIANLLADIQGEGAYRSALALYQGESAAHRMELGAAGKNYEAEAYRSGAEMQSRAGNYAMAGSLLNAGSSLYNRYGNGGPPASAPAANTDPWQYQQIYDSGGTAFA